ncbi:MAG: hypothetical protein NC400_00385 [Clostridium sp.]|nr:hypothetical protein [Clostridium sp.]
MSYTKRKLEELNVIDDFLMNRLASDSVVGEEFCRVLLSTLLQKEIGKVRVTVQKTIPPLSPDKKGIRLDVRVEEPLEQERGKAAAMNIYDIEPHLVKEADYPKHNRFYQALIDSSQMKSGGKEYSRLPDLYILMILEKDPFGYDYMMYTVRNKCEEVQELDYEDGLRFYYFYTDGRLGGNEAVRNMLRYIRDSREENATDAATRQLHKFTESVKIQPEARESYMFWEEYEEVLKERGREEGKEEGKKEGRVETAQGILFDFLKDHGEIPKDVEERLNTEKNPEILRKWVRLAAKTGSIADFVAGM